MKGTGVLVSAAAVLAAMVGGRLITDRIPTEADDAPFYRDASVGERTQLEYAAITVTDVRPAAFLSSNDVIAALGTFVVIDLEVRGTDRSVVLAFEELRAPDGKTYSSTTRGYNCDVSARANPGMTTYARLCFDIPDDALEGLHLRLGRGAKLLADSQRRDEVLDVDLGITRERARTMAATRDMYSGRGGSDVEPRDDEVLPPPSAAPEEGT